MKGDFFMNNEKNKKIWLKKCDEILKMGGRSEVTARNYCYAIKRFLDYYDDKNKMKILSTEQIIKYLKKEFLDKN